MIHIVFETANIEALSKAFELDETIRGEIIEIKDDYAVGPIVDIYDTIDCIIITSCYFGYWIF